MIDSGYSEEFLAWMSTLGAHPDWHKDVLKNSLGRFMFEAWQAGRQEYIEAQKPACTLYKILLTGACHEWGVSVKAGEFSTTEGFPSEAKAREWAEVNGYRVV